MGFYLHLASMVLHTDKCNLARSYVEGGHGDNSNWERFATYTEAFLHTARRGRKLEPHVYCDPKPDDVDRRVIAVYNALRFP